MMEGAIAAAVVPAGTVSRRSVHKLWVTLTNQSTGHVIGTGIKAMVQAPEGFRLVGADVDSQEQWLAALYGDASAEKRLRKLIIESWAFFGTFPSESFRIFFSELS